MRKFLYLRLLAIVTLVTTTSILFFLMYQWIRYIDWDIWFFVTEISIAILAAHSASLLYIYHRCYPDKELSRATDLFYRIASYGGGTVCFILLILVIVSASLELPKGKTSWLTILVIALILIVFAVQLYGGRQLYRTIQQNFRKQLENSFA